MKQKIILISSLVIMFAVAFSQDLKKENGRRLEVPVQVKQAFENQFPGVTAKWDKEGNQYEANFRYKGKAMSATYKADGTVVETEVSIKISELPASVRNYVKEHYRGAAIKEAALITKANGTVMYEAEVRGNDVLFDENGKFVKETND